MISPDSDLYRAHPDWCLHIPGRESITSRHQLVLDVGREDVQAFIVESVSRTLRESGAVYLKWDMNRNFSNIGSAVLPPEKQKRIARETLDVYAPIAHRLGIAEIKNELEDLSFYYLDNEKYHEIAKLVESKKSERDQQIDLMIEDISIVLKTHNIPFRLL